MAPLGPITSHDSIAATGTYPMGSLRVHMVEDEEDDIPPLADAPQSLPTITEGPRRASDDWGGDVLLVLDMPENWTIGIDAASFTAKKFLGTKFIPPGPHFLWWASPGDLGVRSGVWLFCGRLGEQENVHVLQWSSYEETLVDCSRAETRIQTEGLGTYWTNLLDFAAIIQNNIGIWDQLTAYITPQILNAITGTQERAWHVQTGDRVQGESVVAAEVELNRRLSVSLSQRRDLHFSFTQHAKTYTVATGGRDRTIEATDATPYITALLTEPDAPRDEDQLVGELQFAFVVGMNLGNDACLQQWWHMLLNVILKAYLLPSLRPSLATGLLKTLAAQLTYNSRLVEESIMGHDSIKAKDLRLSLTIYKRRLQELMDSLGSEASPSQQLVGSAFAAVEDAVNRNLDWDITGDYLRKGRVVTEDGDELDLEVDDLEAEDERGEWAPEVVELDESGRQKDLVSWKD